MDFSIIAYIDHGKSTLADLAPCRRSIINKIDLPSAQPSEHACPPSHPAASPLRQVSEVERDRGTIRRKAPKIMKPVVPAPPSAHPDERRARGLRAVLKKQMYEVAIRNMTDTSSLPARTVRVDLPPIFRGLAHRRTDSR